MAAHLHQELAVPGELQDVCVPLAVAAEPHVALVVDMDAVRPYRPFVALPRAAPGSDQVARLIEDKYGRGRAAALGDRRIEFESLFVVVQPNQGLLDVLFEYPIRSDSSEFSIHPRLERLGLRTVTALRFLPPGGATRAYEFHGDPGLIRLDPSWHQAALRFVELGFLHILDGPDHLLFLFCLVLPFRRLRSLILVVTAFTVAHSITLIASAYNLGPDALWLPPLIETLIAISIIYMALENIVGANMQRRWVITLAFGLVHGFGFAFALRQQLQFAGSHLLTSLLSFNIGIELGQLLVLVLLILVLEALFRFVVAERIGTIILSALVIHTAWHWMTERADQLSKFPWPALNASTLASTMRSLMVLLIFTGLVWIVFAVVRRRIRRRDHHPRG